MEKITSKKGHSAEIAKLGPNGGINKLIVPVGENRKGWKSLITCIQSLTNQSQRAVIKPQTSADIYRSFSYRDALKKSQEENPVCNQQQTNAVPAPTQPEFASIFLSSSIIIQRKYFHDSWYDIMRALQQHLSALSSVSPLQPDKALLACEDEQARILANIRGWYKVGKYLVRFYPWSVEAMIGEPKVPSYGGWIKIRNLPLDKWTIETFRQIGDVCGGYLEF